MRTLKPLRLITLMRAPLVVLIVSLTGCSLGTKKTAAVPPPPNPAAVQPAAPEQPLSIPQTSVVLPSAQPINPAALAQAPPPAAQAAAKTADAPAPPRVPRRVVAVPPKPEVDQEAEAPATPAPAVEEQPRIQPILRDDEIRQIKTAIESRKKDIRDSLYRARTHSTPANTDLVKRIESFMAQADEAEKLGDYTQADALSERASILAKELQVE